PKLDSALIARADRTQWTKKPTVPSWNAGSTGPGFGGALHINDNDIDVGASQAGTSFALAVVDWTFASSALLSGNRFTNLSLYVRTALVVMKRVVVTGSLIVNYAAEFAPPPNGKAIEPTSDPVRSALDFMQGFMTTEQVSSLYSENQALVPTIHVLPLSM